MPSAAFHCQVITPESAVIDDEAVSAIVPLSDGLMGFLPNRAPIVGQLGMGNLRIDFADSSKGKGGSRSFFVEDGFVQMLDNRLTILASRAIGEDRLSESEAEAELRAANASTTDGLAAPEKERVHKARRRAEAKLQAARSFKTKGGF